MGLTHLAGSERLREAVAVTAEALIRPVRGEVPIPIYCAQQHISRQANDLAQASLIKSHHEPEPSSNPVGPHRT